MPSSNVDQIKERLSIVDVVSTYIKLEKAGSNVKAKCPFHNEKTPSFFVSPARNTYYCFGCGAKGDIFSFIEQFEGLDFQGALKVLADRAGVTITHDNIKDRNERSRLYDVLAEASQLFNSNLKTQDHVQKYLKNRGLKVKNIKHFELGYALPEWRSTYDYLKGKGFSDVEIEQAGLCILATKKEGMAVQQGGEKRYYDRFRGRIMFPIADSSGRIVAFSGRIFPEEDDKMAKYVNSPETPLFHKSRVLYGFDKAKLSIRKFDFSILVEGQMDLVMSHQSGFTNTVALSGTALTKEQITMLQRLSNNLVLAFDADAAGITSSGRNAEMALETGMDVKVANIPQGVDPADLAKQDSNKLKKAIRESRHIIDFYLDMLTAEKGDHRTFSRKVERLVLPFVARIPSKIDQAYFIAKVAGCLGISEDTVKEEVSKISITSQDKKQPTNKTEQPSKPRREIIENKIVGTILWQKSLPSPLIDVKTFNKSLESIVGKEHFNKLMSSPESVEQEALFLAEIEHDDEQLEQETQELLQHLEEIYLREQYEDALAKLRLAEQKHDEKLVQKKLEECKQLSERINVLKAQS